MGNCIYALKRKNNIIDLIQFNEHDNDKYISRVNNAHCENNYVSKFNEIIDNSRHEKEKDSTPHKIEKYKDYVIIDNNHFI